MTSRQPADPESAPAAGTVPRAGRLRRLRRAVRTGDWHAIGFHLRTNAFPPALFRACEVTFFAMSEPPPLTSELDGFQAYQAKPEDAPKLERIRPPRSESYRERLERGDVCSFGEYRGEPVSMLWVVRPDWYVARAEAFRFRLRAGECWAQGGHVAPQFRRLGLFRRQWHHMVLLMRTLGLATAWYTVLTENTPSMVANERAGARVAYRMRLFRLAGMTYHRVFVPGIARPIAGTGPWVDEGGLRDRLAAGGGRADEAARGG